MSSGTLRVAILCDRETLEPWHRRCVERLLAVDGVAVVGFVRTEGGESTAPRSRMVSRLYERRFHRRTRRESVLLSEVAPDVPAVSTVDASAVRELNVDIALSLVLGGAAVDALDHPRYGVWAFDFDLDPAARAGFGEVGRVLAGEPTTEIALLRLEATTDRVAVLRQGWFRGDARAPQNGVRRARIEAAGWPALVCAALLRGESSRAEGPYVDMTAVTQPSPSSLDILRYGLAVLGSNLNFAWGHLFRHQQWNIGIVDKPIQALLDAESPPPVRWFPLDGKRAFLADPFGTGATILCEHFDYRRNKGTICSIDVSDGEFSAPQPAFELPVHASYPFLVEDDGALYCIPETMGSREVALFRADAFPRGWTKVSALVSDVSVVDPTLFHHEGRWWLACAEGERGAEANLLLWHAPRIEGPWTPHTGNPVKTDVRSSRPAGTPFEHQGRLYRPAQDCSRGYGERVVINNVTRLTPDEFAEEPVAVIEPTRDSPYPAGRHTLSAFGSATLIDGHRFVFVGVACWNFLRILARSIAGRVR